MRKHNDRMQIRIHLDDQTVSNLKSMRAERKRLGLSRKKLSELTGIRYGAIADYETGRYAPHLSRYLKLAEFFGWDIRDSPNYKFAKTTAKYGLKKRKRYYGLNAEEISRLTNFSEGSIENALYVQSRSTINSFAAVMKVLDDEDRRSTLVQELTCKSKT